MASDATSDVSSTRPKAMDTPAIRPAGVGGARGAEGAVARQGVDESSGASICPSGGRITFVFTPSHSGVAWRWRTCDGEGEAHDGAQGSDERQAGPQQHQRAEQHPARHHREDSPTLRV